MEKKTPLPPSITALLNDAAAIIPPFLAMEMYRLEIPCGEPRKPTARERWKRAEWERRVQRRFPDMDDLLPF